MINGKSIKDQINIKDCLLHLGAKETGHTNLSCPFHASKSGQSLVYDESKGVFQCSNPACKARDGGDIFNAVAIAEDLDIKSQFPEVLRRTCELMGIPLPFNDESEKRNHQKKLAKRNNIKSCNKTFFDLCKSYWETEEGKDVLKECIDKRGYPPEYITENLGYFPSNKVKEVVDQMHKQSSGYYEVVDDKKKYFGNTFYSFKGRIIHPHFYRGELLHFTAERTKYSEREADNE